MEGAATPEATRRTTRAALAEIPMRLDRMRVTPLQLVTNTREHSPTVPSSYLSPAASPDEVIIQQRGRRRVPANWSPDIESKRNYSFHSLIQTPPKNTSNRMSPGKLGVTLRSTPRKRLLLGDERIPLTPEKIDFTDISTPQKFKLISPVKETPPTKRQKIERKLDLDCKGPLDTALKGLSPVQLIGIIKSIVQKHPNVEQEVRDDMPAPDLAPIEEKLNYLKLNIFKSLPTSRLTSKTDSPAFSRVATHLGAFKKYVVEQGKTLVESQHWSSVMQYVFLAWSYVKATPVWDNVPHNAQRRHCFKALGNFCMTALRKGGLDKYTLLEAHDKLQGMIVDSEDLQSCLKYVEGQLHVL